jgi:hypothetical protein
MEGKRMEDEEEGRLRDQPLATYKRKEKEQIKKRGKGMDEG